MVRRGLRRADRQGIAPRCKHAFVGAVRTAERSIGELFSPNRKAALRWSKHPLSMVRYVGIERSDSRNEDIRASAPLKVLQKEFGFTTATLWKLQGAARAGE